MKKIVLLVWLLIPVGALAYHFGPGQEQMQLDDAKAFIAEAESHVDVARDLMSKEAGKDAADCCDSSTDSAGDHWSSAEEAYGKAIEVIPSDEIDLLRNTRLELAKVKMFVSKLPEARDDLSQLVDELQNDKNSDPNVLAEARSALANAQYYRTWLMRLEGLKRDVWEPEIEASRQTYKLLASQAKESGNESLLVRATEDLESAIRLARMDITELQGLPLPSE